MSAAGLSKPRLGRMADVMRGYVERGEVAGVVTDMVAILLAQRLMSSPTPSDFYADFWTSAYQAVDD